MDGEPKYSATGDSLGAKLRDLRGKKGGLGSFWPSVLATQRRFKVHVRCLYHRVFRGGRYRIDGADYAAFYHIYNKTWTNERAVEVPFVWSLVQGCGEGRILEIGNVLSHYFPIRHDIVDKYEERPGVMNVDVVDYAPAHRYRLIVAISTLEHVGWDETPREEGKVARAIERLKSLLEPGGRLVATFPVGHNAFLDRSLDEGRSGFDRVICLKRLSKTRWAEAPWAEVRGARYDEPWPCANGLVIGSAQAAQP